MYLHSVENGKVDISMGTTYTSLATYSCNTGYELRGDSTRLCQASGTWSGDQPSCDVIGNTRKCLAILIIMPYLGLGEHGCSGLEHLTLN